VRDKDLHDEAGGLLDVFNNREKKIISRRFGFGGGKRKTLEEVGWKLGVSRERIRQMKISSSRNYVACSAKRTISIGLPVAA
jgi:RNA polymerase nonessential primary-like sigma factor